MNHHLFLKHLRESSEAVRRVAKWLASTGAEVAVPETREASTASEWKEHADDGDIFVKNPLRRIEVKHLGVSFTNCHNWPFKDFIVCGKEAFDRAAPSPFAIIILNKEMTHAAVVMGVSQQQWWVERRRDRRYQNYSQEFYVTHPEGVSYHEIGETNETVGAPDTGSDRHQQSDF